MNEDCYASIDSTIGKVPELSFRNVPQEEAPAFIGIGAHEEEWS